MSTILSKIAVTDAQTIILDLATATEPETIEIALARGRILGQSVRALRSLPTSDTSILDGYALNLGESPFAKDYRVVTESAAGHPAPRDFGPHECARISTGAVVPRSAQVVVAQENVTRHQDIIRISDDFVGQLRPGQYISKIGSDVMIDEDLKIGPGRRLGPGELGLLAACGHSQIEVYRRPTVAIICTGDELVPIGTPPGPGQVISTNGMMLTEQILEAGAVLLSCEDIGDDDQSLEQALRNASKADILITSGGISVGDHDRVYPTLTGLGFDCKFRQLRLRPGKPTTFGKLGNTLVFALPGNPASSYVACELFVRPLIQKQLGRPRPAWFRPKRKVALSSAIQSDRNRSHFLRAIVSQETGQPLAHQSSGALTSLAGHNALIEVPEGQDFAKGEPIWAHLLADYL